MTQAPFFQLLGDSIEIDCFLFLDSTFYRFLQTMGTIVFWKETLFAFGCLLLTITADVGGGGVVHDGIEHGNLFLCLVSIFW
jgi:hypothetical protein